MEISFTPTFLVNEDHYPKPSKNVLPDWYKNTESYIDGIKKMRIDNSPDITIKKCIPIFDSLSAGYIIFSVTDIQVSFVNGFSYFQWKPSSNADNISYIMTHPSVQAKLHPKTNGEDVPKWKNPWGIKTSKGYSTLFIPPMNRDSVFEIFPAIVDTDTYNSEVHFPFVLKDKTWEGVIPEGTPIAQVIPFKRENWNMKIGNQKNLEEMQKQNLKIDSAIYDGYKKKFWNKKSFN